MSDYPRLVIDTEKIKNNTKTISKLAGDAGMSVFGVTKASCGDPKVAQAMLDGGAEGLAESRIENIIRLRESGFDGPIMLLRTPMISQADEVVAFSDMSLNSEISVLKALSDAASKQGKKHRVIIMVEMGDLREGETEKKTPPLLDRTLELDGIELYGMGMNLACFAGVIPTLEKISKFESLVTEEESRLGIKFEMISGGNSGNIPLLLDEPQMGRIDNLRIGEGILLGLETAYREPIPETYQDAFKIEAEVIESKTKPSVPFGTVTQNAYGETPAFEDLGDLKRTILALGRQDTILEDITPLDKDLEMIGGSSDHMVLNDINANYNPGEIVSFIPSYGALVASFTSRYVHKVYI